MVRPLLSVATAFGLTLGCQSALAQAVNKSDWQPTQFDAVKLARDVERTFRSFRNVCARSDYKVQCPYPADPKGVGDGGGMTNSYFWSPAKYRIEYLAVSTQRATKGIPVSEWIIRDGKGVDRIGQEVTNVHYSPQSHLFDAPSDAQLVESWPTRFPKFLFSPFVGGNATLSRYLAALGHGVGGFHVTRWSRTIRSDRRAVTQYRIRADRPAKGSRPAASVDMVFNVGMPTLPVVIQTTYGAKNRLNWNFTWMNAAKMPANPHSHIGEDPNKGH